MLPTESAKVKILFLCTGNSCRSQMAEEWAHHLKGNVLDAYSAGTEPHGMNHLAIMAMKEVGVDISLHHSKSLDELAGIRFDYVVTVCDHAQESCPVFAGEAKVVHVGFPDPPKLAEEAGATTDEAALPHYRQVRDAIRSFVEALPDGLESDSNGAGA